MSFTIVQDQDVKEFGIEVAYTLANIRTLVGDDGKAIVSSPFLIKLGIVSSKSSASRLLKKLEALSLITLTLKRVGGSFVNEVQLKEPNIEESGLKIVEAEPEIVQNKTNSVEVNIPAAEQVITKKSPVEKEDFAQATFQADGFYIDKNTQEVVIVAGGKRHFHPFWPRLTNNAKKDLLAKHGVDNVTV